MMRVGRIPSLDGHVVSEKKKRITEKTLTGDGFQDDTICLDIDQLLVTIKDRVHLVPCSTFHAHDIVQKNSYERKSMIVVVTMEIKH